MKTFAFLLLVIATAAAAAFGGFQYGQTRMRGEIDAMAVTITKDHKRLNRETIDQLKGETEALKSQVAKMAAELQVKSAEVKTVMTQSSTAVAQVKTENQALKVELESLKRKPAASTVSNLPPGIQRIN